MKASQLPSLIVLTSIVAAPVLVTQAADEDATASAPESFDRVSLTYRPGFNIKASFSNIGQLPLSNPGRAAGGISHTYNNGYVRLDSSGNEGGLTWNWGYDHPGQIKGDSLVMNSSLPGTIARDVDADPQHGFELSYLRQVGVLGKGPWGIEMAFNYTDVGMRHNGLSRTGPVIVDAYALDGIIPPEAPYRGSFDTPGPLIADAPTRVPVSLVSQLEASVYGFRLGPFLEVPLFDRMSALFSGGFALAIVDGEFEFQQFAAIPGGGSILRTGRDGQTDLLPGGYLAASLLYHVNDSVALSAGLQYQNVGSFTESAGDKQAKLDLGAAIFLTAGFTFSF